MRFFQERCKGNYGRFNSLALPIACGVDGELAISIAGVVANGIDTDKHSIGDLFVLVPISHQA